MIFWGEATLQQQQQQQPYGDFFQDMSHWHQKKNLPISDDQIPWGFPNSIGAPPLLTGSAHLADPIRRFFGFGHVSE